MVLIFHKRSVREDIANAYRPELSCEHLEVVYESLSPGGIPGPGINRHSRAHCQDRSPKLFEGDFVVAWRQKTIRLKRRNHKMAVLLVTFNTLVTLDNNVKFR
jgi:hypothetical protein